MGRSIALTHGRRWPIFGLVLVGGLLFQAMRLFSDRLTDTAPADAESTSVLLVAWIATYVEPAIAAVFWAVAASVTYCSLRLMKEGARLEARVT